MGISTSVAVEFEETTLLPPAVILPLDITKFISDWTLGVPQPLMDFYALSKQLRQQLNRLPAKNAEVPADWIAQGTAWAQEVAAILNDMHNITQTLLATKPADLRGNMHPVEEYAADIASTIEEFEKIVGPLRRAKAENTAQIAKSVESIRNMYLFLKIAKR